MAVLSFSGALAARATTKWSYIIIETGPRVCIETGTHARASGIDHGRVRLASTTTTSHNMAAIQLTQSHGVLDYSIYL